ncbi:hypothetical protein COCNU_scaffold017833G000010 [Cocos nucifera]|nr:hypothetical protein [Cocos nucifera]
MKSGPLHGWTDERGPRATDYCPTRVPLPTPNSLSRTPPSDMAVAARLPLVCAVRSSSVGEHEKRMEERGVMGQVLRVVRRDRKFLTRRFQSVSKVLGDLFWLRNLEDPRALHASRLPAHWSKISHPPGLWGVDLMMADIEALKVYADYIQLASRIWSVPLPDLYDPQKVSDYFNCRPHVLAFRIIELGSPYLQDQT